MSQVSDILATLQLLRADAEALAHHKHLEAAQESLKETRKRVHELLPVSPSPAFQQAYELSLRRAEIEWLYWSHRQALEQSTLPSLEKAQGCQALVESKNTALSELPEAPALNLEDQESLYQALMCNAVEQYVDQTIADSYAA